ncbi:glycoside hydrolase family 13 protein [Streptomonospora nanhaiensis]|uniref:Alpha-glucosidase n=1 Tax=Streptomonospora nanhaiensis TaxID=1323731 RepID=A0A853BH77_9ACTN|nr:glycoside hydrolase family 13 protein [Streptomonospora nanhaiensis]MBV2364450.1 glycoside hydrolase family 13 protein [Streptomonospora nanhaiensis]MBX9387892.1 glycoside hydrolase family 13 protein [Streptomonospora nanhaiensis]NYI94084.1 alpha-glucosidase [Streptomonospora nanhaiensis]
MSDLWWRDAVIYQIYPRSFADTDGDGIGDLPGVTRRLDHLAGLGVDALWLSPFYPSPLADGGYDVADFRGVDPRLGTLADFDDLVAAAHARGIRVIVDIVPNHTSEQHPWFAEALAAPPGSPARERYVFRDGRGPGGDLPPSNWESRFGGPAWTRVPDGQWYLHLFAPEQPDLNWDNPEVRAEFLDILRFWSRRGVDGFRIDVAYGLVKDLREPLREVVPVPEGSGLDDVATNPDHPYWDRPEVHEIYREWRRVFQEFDPPRMAVAEAWLPSDRLVRYLRPDELQTAFNFEFLRCRWDAEGYRRVIDTSLADAAEVGTVATWVMSNHDVVRPASALGLPNGTDLSAWLLSDGTRPPLDTELGLRRARAAALLELALPGSAYLYQGEELGLHEVADLPREVLQDPKWERSGRTSKGRDGCRVPIPWERTGPSLGFGAAEGWLPQPRHWGELSVEAQTGDPASTLELYRAALRLRRSLPADAPLEWDSDLDKGDVLAFRRGPQWLVVVNTGAAPVPLPPGASVALASAPVEGGELPGDTAVWLRV